MRIGASIVAYTLPVLRQGDITTFIGMWIVIGLSAWFFSAYPIGGWSHSAFHIVISLLPPICLHHACGLTVSQGQIVKAIMCASSSSSSSMNDVIMQHGLSFQ